jgi:hypothetical protein
MKARRAQQPPNPERNPCMTRLLVPALVASALFAGGCSGGPPAPNVTTTPRALVEVVYLLEGKGIKLYDSTSRVKADITIATPTGTAQEQDVDVPLMNESGTRGLHFTDFAPGDFVYISAQNSSELGGTLTCAIEVDGVRISENTASGEYAIVTCKGRA